MTGGMQSFQHSKSAFAYQDPRPLFFRTRSQTIFNKTRVNRNAHTRSSFNPRSGNVGVFLHMTSVLVVVGPPCLVHTPYSLTVCLDDFGVACGWRCLGLSRALSASVCKCASALYRTWTDLISLRRNSSYRMGSLAIIANTLSHRVYI